MLTNPDPHAFVALVKLAESTRMRRAGVAYTEYLSFCQIDRLIAFGMQQVTHET